MCEVVREKEIVALFAGWLNRDNLRLMRSQKWYFGHGKLTFQELLGASFGTNQVIK